MKRARNRRYVGAIHVVALLGFTALPAHSADPMTVETQTLTLIDSVPTKDQILQFTVDPVPHLRGLALSSSTDFGVRLRATRALPQFCTTQTPQCKDDSDAAMSPVRAAVLDVIGSVGTNDLDGRSLLRLRAGIEALGAIQSGEQSDVDTLVDFLGHPSRDIRFATARALRDLCIQTAIPPLRNRHDEEPVAQVRLAISAALGDLAQCSQ